MTITTKNTAAEIAAAYNKLTGKTIKPTSYPKAKLMDMLKAAQVKASAARMAKETRAKTKKPAKTKPAPTVALVDLLINPEEFDPKSDNFITLNEIAGQVGLKPKTARARMRKQLIDDKAYTRYIFKNEPKIITKVKKALGA